MQGYTVAPAARITLEDMLQMPGKLEGAVTIASAAYDSGNGTVALTLDDGRTLTLIAGHHIEEAEEW